MNKPPGHLSFVLHTVTRLHGPRLLNYYGFICHLTSHRVLLELPLVEHLPASSSRSLNENRQRGQCQASPVTSGSLKLTPSSITHWTCSQIGHRAILDAYPPNTPNQVRLRYVPTPFYGFLQTPPLASDALAIRITFPVNRAVSASSSL